jgi:HEAT repeat protein
VRPRPVTRPPTLGEIASSHAVAAEPAIAPPEPAAKPPPLPATEIGLEERYLAPSTPPAERAEVIRALGRFQTAAAAGVLARIFDREKRFDAKMEVLEVVADNRDEACREGKLTVLCAGLADLQPRRVRLASLQALLDVVDPRLPAILAQLSNDQDPLIRSQATEALKDARR